MSILLVDDDSGIRRVLEFRLRSEGFHTISARNAREAYKLLGIYGGNQPGSGIDLILMDILMPDIRGIDACTEIKSMESLKDIPIILMTASSDYQHLEEAFNAGAMDYISKPFKNTELLARIRSALRLKSEIDQRKHREEELVIAARELREANIQLERLSAVDGLTQIFNRRYFDAVLAKEFQRSIRNQTPISLIMIDIDGFKAFNDFYGHVRGDECLKQIATELNKVVKRSHDFIARYGGEEFAVVLPETSTEGVASMAEALRSRMESLSIDHLKAPAGTCVTISLGATSMLPRIGTALEELIKRADRALYQSKMTGRNRFTLAPEA
ncbi:MAG: diguanylate cyclase [Methylococcaceae bacterium]|nr:diguanylate cyclase [Methylococcaceae bacterium]